jgi:hypothetical protein
MRSDGETKVKSILKTMFITPKQDIFRFAKVTLLLFICSVVYDIGISWSVFKYSQSFFIANEANILTISMFTGNIWLTVFSIILHLVVISFILYTCKRYHSNIDVKKERDLMISANVYVFVLACGAFAHFAGGTTWLV